VPTAALIFVSADTRQKSSFGKKGKVLNLGHLYFDIVSDLELRISDFASLGIFTFVESPLQITYFLCKTKPILSAVGGLQMNVNLYNTTDYENKWQRRVRKNKPNSNPIKPNLRKAKMNVNSLITKDYRKKEDFAVQKNKPNSNPILSAVGGLQMNVNLYVTKDYSNEQRTMNNERLCKTNPIKPNLKS